jgi:hypothetical protein
MSQRRISMLFTSQEQSLRMSLRLSLGQESDRQRTETESVGSDYLSISTGEFHRGNGYTSPAKSHFISKMRFTEPTPYPEYAAVSV